MENILDKIKNTRILAVIGLVCMVLGTIFAYIKISIFGYSNTISLWGYWEGKIVLLLVIANLIFIFKDFVEKYIPSLFNTSIGRKIKDINNPKASLVPTILSAVFAVYLHTKLDVSSEYMSWGLGFYALWLGVICLVAYAIVHKNN